MKKLLTLVMVILLIAMTVLPVAALEVVDTEAVVGVAGLGPEVLAAWQWAPGYQVGTEILPNTENAVPSQGADTTICTWAVVTDPNGIGDLTDVFFKVYHPDGSFKLQVHMQRVYTAAEWEAAKAIAVSSGQITAAWAYDLDVMLEKNAATMWEACWTYQTHQMPGWYTTTFTGVDQAGNVGDFDAYLNILPLVVLAIDFETVNFGPIVPNAAKWVMGNDIFSWGDGRPTVWNQGNTNAGLLVKNSPMVGVNYMKQIIDFDVKFMGQTEVYKANQVVTLAGPLRPCTPIQIDFSIHPPFGIPADTYEGTIDVGIYMLNGTAS